MRLVLPLLLASAAGAQTFDFAFTRAASYSEKTGFGLEWVRTAAGAFDTLSFLVNVRTAACPGGEAWAWDKRIPLEFADAHPSVCRIEVENARVPTLYIAGDSTSTDLPVEPYNRWGQMFTRFFQPGIAVANHGESGESLRGFLGDRPLANLMSVIQPGDFLLIQMGPYDQKKRGEGVGAFTTPMYRLNFDARGKIVNTLGDYPKAVRQTGRAANVPGIHLNAKSAPFYEALGPAAANKAFAGRDTTRQARLPLARYLSDMPPFDAAHPDPPAFDLPADPLQNAQKPYGN